MYFESPATAEKFHNFSTVARSVCRIFRRIVSDEFSAVDEIAGA